MYDCRVIVGIEFGATHSGFGYANISSTEDISFYNQWSERLRTIRVPTVLSYDDEYENVQSWGYPALESSHVELFKFLLGEMENKPPLPREKAISDYLHELSKIVKEKICRRWESIDFYNQVLIILTIPDNYKISTWDMREYAFKAGLLNDCYSQNFKLITESEATALFCIKYLRKCNLSAGEKFMVVECGDSTINLTTRMLLIDEKLSVVLEQIEDNCAVEQELLKFLEQKIGSSAVSLLRKHQPQQLQYLQSAIKSFLTEFTGTQSESSLIEFDLKEHCPSITEYCEGEYHDNMVRDDWRIKLEFEDVKAMVDPVIERTIQLIDSQLHLRNNDCFALSLVGKFAKSIYFQLRIGETFNKRVQFISVPLHPESAIMRGAVLYGQNYVNMSDNDNIIENIQFHLSQTIKRLDEEKKKLQEDYNDLTNKYNEEANQHQITVENLKNDIEGLETHIEDINQLHQTRINDIKDTEEKYLKNIQELENQINDINQQYQNKIKLQEQRESQMQNKLQEEIQTLNNNFNDHKLLYNDLQENYNDLTNKYSKEANQHQIIVENLNNDIKKLENQIEDINQQYQNKIKLQEQRESQMQNKLQEEIQTLNNNFNKYKLLHDNLQEKYDELTNKCNEETIQHQMIVENLKSDIKNIEDKYLVNIKQLENKMSDIDQQQQSKIKLQEQQIDQLQQSLELKEIQLQSLEKDLGAINNSLYQKNIFKDELLNYQLDDVGQNYIINLNNDISKLNNNLKKYITDLDQDVIVNIEEIKKLLLLYKCPVKITNQKDNLLLIQAVLQRHIIETIFSYATKYFQSTGQHYHLESNIINQASSLSTLLTDASKYRTGNNEIMRIASTKLRKQIYLILNNCGFSDMYGKNNAKYEHPFITFYKEKLNKTINELRTIKDQEKITVDHLAATIIREVIKIFWFRLKIHESVAQYVWIPFNAKVDEIFMEGENFDDSDNENLYVDLCYFPLIGKDLTSNNHEVYVPAKVFVRKNQ
ncbi:138_t:CDS:10 [Rhizophagus irregularis]|nr:138_t:CDS:10 [Rhizophagus irregularis]